MIPTHDERKKTMAQITRLQINPEEEREAWASHWLEEYKRYSHIEPSNTFECLVGMTAGESAEYALEQYKAYSE